MVEESRRAQAAHARAAEGLPKAGAGPVAEKPDDKVCTTVAVTLMVTLIPRRHCIRAAADVPA
eukprot:3489781-Rhodomonas_salina.1